MNDEDGSQSDLTSFAWRLFIFLSIDSSLSFSFVRSFDAVKWLISRMISMMNDGSREKETSYLRWQRKYWFTFQHSKQSSLREGSEIHFFLPLPRDQRAGRRANQSGERAKFFSSSHSLYWFKACESFIPTRACHNRPFSRFQSLFEYVKLMSRCIISLDQRYLTR